MQIVQQPHRSSAGLLGDGESAYGTPGPEGILGLSKRSTILSLETSVEFFEVDIQKREGVINSQMMMLQSAKAELLKVKQQLADAKTKMKNKGKVIKI
jgi:hypothetical protein